MLLLLLLLLGIMLVVVLRCGRLLQLLTFLLKH